MPHTTRLLLFTVFISLLALCGCNRQQGQPASTTPATQGAAHYGQVPLSFEANHGQAKEPVKFLARGTNATLYLTPHEAALEVRSSQPTTDHQPPTTALVKMKLLGAKEQPRLQGQQELPGKSSYFSGKNTSQWKTNIPTYQQVKYEQVYDGIDLVYYGNQQQLEYDFIVQPGADPNAIKFRLEGAEEIALNEAGDLVLQTTAGEVKQHKPVIYQEVDGKRQEIAGNYVMQDGEVGFAVGAYDSSQALVIDPVIVYATATGSNGLEGNGPSAIAVDQAGCAYIGKSQGPVATPGAYENGTGLSITKLNATGTAALYTVNLYGGPQDWIQGIAVDQQGNCYLTGQANSSAFVTTPGAFQTDYGITCGACRNAFVTKINPTGSALVYSTFLKGDDSVGSKTNIGWGITADAQGNAYVTGTTSAKDFPVTPGAYQNTFNSYKTNHTRDVFITKLNANGSSVLYSTFLGSGGSNDYGTDIKLDAAGNIYVTGVTSNGYISGQQPFAAKFPVTPGAYQTTDTFGLGSSYFNVFVTKLAPNLGSLSYSTLIGTVPSNQDYPRMALDAPGNVLIAANTSSSYYPTTPGAFKTTFTAKYQGQHVVITKLNATGSALIYSTFLGGNNSEESVGIAVDAEGNATITGLTTSSDYPQTGIPDTFTQATGVITKLNAIGNALLHSRFIPFSRPERLVADTSGDLYLIGLGKPELQLTSNTYATNGSPILAKLKLPKSAVTVSAANYSGSPLACEAIVSTFGTGLATSTQSAISLPLPKTLGGTTVKVIDSAGTERDAALFFASPTQINFQLPPATANGNATITITAQDGASFVSNVEIANVAPSIFSADTSGKGFAAAHAQRTGSLTFEQVVRFDFNKGQWVALPIDLGPASEQVYLILYGTGIRLRSNLNNVTATIGGTPATVSYAGAQNDFVGLDQVNVLIPRSLIGRGTADVILNVDGKITNTVKVSIK